MDRPTSQPLSPPESSRSLELEPVGQLLRRLAAELPHDFSPGKAIRISRAPACLDVMGGIAEYTGSHVCQATLGCAAAVTLSPRDDRDIQAFSFNLLDANQPFTARIPLDALAVATPERLRADLAEPGRRWAGHFFGCLFVLHERGLVDLADPGLRGFNLAVLSTIPPDAGSSSAIAVATMVNLLDHFGLRDRLTPVEASSLCQQAEQRIVGSPCVIAEVLASLLGRERELFRLACQPHDVLPAVVLPPKIRVVGIHCGVTSRDADERYERTRCAASMAHTMILHRMQEIAAARGEQLASDPTRGYLANLDQDHYKTLFRPLLPEILKGSDFLAKHASHDPMSASDIPFANRHPERTREGSGHEVQNQMLRGYAQHDNCRDESLQPAWVSGHAQPDTQVDLDTEYHIQQAADHHVLESRRVRQFVTFLEQAAQHEVGTRPRMLALDKAGHLMYASHISYTNDALLGAPECDLLVKLVRDREREGFYGARITSRGCGGTVAILCNESERADEAIAAIMTDYEKRTGKTPILFDGTGPGAFGVPAPAGPR